MLIGYSLGVQRRNQKSPGLSGVTSRSFGIELIWIYAVIFQNGHFRIRHHETHINLCLLQEQYQISLLKQAQIGAPCTHLRSNTQDIALRQAMHTALKATLGPHPLVKRLVTMGRPVFRSAVKRWQVLIHDTPVSTSGVIAGPQ